MFFPPSSTYMSRRRTWGGVVHHASMWYCKRNHAIGLTTTVECVAMWRLNCPPFSVTSTCFIPGGGRSSNDCTKRPSTMESNGMAMMIPGQERRPAPKGRKRKSLPLASMFAFKKRSGMNFSGWSQYLGLFAIHHAFTRILLSAGMSYPASLASWRFMWGTRSGIAMWSLIISFTKAVRYGNLLL